MSKLPHGVLNELKCADCRSYLSQAPIKIIGDGRGICGRCPAKVGIHSSTYEKLAGIFVYPCKYRQRGCQRALTFREVPYHESECSYRPSCCFCCKHPCQPCGSKPNDKDINGDKPIIADDRILSTLRCATCPNYLSSSPIFISPDGLDICSSCAQNVVPALPRNTPLETILNAFVFQCRYINYGCDNLFSFGAISMHESNCEYHYQRMLLEDRKRQDVGRNISRKESVRTDLNNPRRDKWMMMNGPLMEELNAMNLSRHSQVIHEQPRMELERDRFNNHDWSEREHPRMSQMGQRMDNADMRRHRESSESSQREQYRYSQRGQPIHRESSQMSLQSQMGQPQYRDSSQQSQMGHALYRENSQLSQMSQQSQWEQPRSSQQQPPMDPPRMSQQQQQPPTEQAQPDEEDQAPQKLAKKSKDKGKKRGLVDTPRGYIFATITPNTIVAFKSAGKKQLDQDGASGRSTPSNSEERGGTTYNQMVQEFKVKQKHHAIPLAVE